MVPGRFGQYRRHEFPCRREDDTFHTAGDGAVFCCYNGSIQGQSSVIRPALKLERDKVLV